MNILIDMNLSPRWADLFLRKGIDAVHWSQVGSPKATDDEILAWATENDRIILTHDLDFTAMLAIHRKTSPSVVQIRCEDVNPDRIGVRVITSIQQSAAELSQGAIVSIDPVRARLRLLPLV